MPGRLAAVESQPESLSSQGINGRLPRSDSVSRENDGLRNMEDLQSSDSPDESIAIWFLAAGLSVLLRITTRPAADCFGVDWPFCDLVKPLLLLSCPNLFGPAVHANERLIDIEEGRRIGVVWRLFRYICENRPVGNAEPV